MRGPITTTSDLNADAQTVWERVASFEGINDEFAGLLRMTAPAEVRAAGLDGVRVGERLCRSWILLLGVLPIDYDDITVIELDPPHGFLERSPMLSNRLWEHRRTIEHTGPATCRVTDAIRWDPRVALPMAPVYRGLFRLRHRRLRRHFGGHAA